MLSFHNLYPKRMGIVTAEIDKKPVPQGMGARKLETKKIRNTRMREKVKWTANRNMHKAQWITMRAVSIY